MSQVSGQVPNFISGVSQQAFSLRLASQAQDQVNGWPSVVTGLDKRPPTEHAAQLSSTPSGETPFLHIINRDVIERYVVLVQGGDLKVYRFDGTEVTVNFPQGKGYLSGSSFASVTVADFTFLTNRDVKTAMAATPIAGTRPPEATVSVRIGNYSTTYNISVSIAGWGSWGATYTTSANDANTIKTDNIAAQLVGQVAAWGAGFGVTSVGSTVYINRSDGTPFSIAVSDSYGDEGLLLAQGKVQSAALLPPRSLDGVILEIEGQAGNRFDNQFVQYQAGTNTWKEVPKPGRKIHFDAATMPHVLVREADGTFTFREGQWGDCRCGDENTAPEPGWVGRAISDVFFYRNRLGVIAGENVGMTRNGKFFDFWRETAQQVLDTDPIDVSISHVKVSDLRWAVPFNETLLLFSDQTQFIDNSGGVLTPATVDFRPVTELEGSLGSRPLGLGTFVYFGAKKGGYTALREYYLDGAARAAQANDITAHVPALIKGDIQDMAVSSTEDCVMVLGAGDRSSIWTYKFAYAGQEKVQSAWARWQLPSGDTILAIEFIQSTLWLVISRAAGIFLERIDLDPGRTLGALSWVPKLDRLLIGSRATAVTFDAATQKTTFTLPFAETDLQGFVVDGAGPAGRKPGELFSSLERPAANQVVVPGDWTSTAARNSIIFGRPYELRHTFSPLLIRQEAAGGGSVAVTDGRLQLGTFRVNYTDTGYFRAEVTPFRRQTYTYVFTGRVIGSARTRIGDVPMEGGTFSFPIRTNNMEATIALVNDSAFPSRFLNGEWSGNYTPRAKKVD